MRRSRWHPAGRVMFGRPMCNAHRRQRPVAANNQQQTGTAGAVATRCASQANDGLASKGMRHLHTRAAPLRRDDG